MKKTPALIAKYFKLLNEQEPATELPKDAQSPPTDATAPEQTPPEPAPPQELPVDKVDENVKHVIKILTNAFIFNPTLFDKNKQIYINNKISQLSKSVNVPVVKVVDEIKKIISLDHSLRIESKTLSVLNKYISLYEKSLDATDMNDSETPKEQSTKQAAPVKPDQNKLNLAEIFPLYKELILKALSHIPTDEELMIIKPVVDEFSDVDPEKIVETIQDLLNQSLEDTDMEGLLGNA